MSEETQTAAAQYRAMMASHQPEIVTIPDMPSGFSFRFRKPNAFALIFDERAGLLETAAAIASEEWEKQGVAQPPAESEGESADQIKVQKKINDTIDRVCELSFEPKIVLSAPKNDSEICYTEIGAADLEHIYKWVASGGSPSVMMAMFPQRRQPNALASLSRKKRRK